MQVSLHQFLYMSKSQALVTEDAAIQGKDCLVQKFRNSSVMLEAPHYRPKVRLPVWVNMANTAEANRK
jgi:hypothetical protein